MKQRNLSSKQELPQTTQLGKNGEVVPLWELKDLKEAQKVPLQNPRAIC